MAEGILRERAKKSDIDFDIVSAGIETHGVNPRAIKVMKDIGIDISHHTSNNVKEYLDRNFDYIITVCDNAAENCPIFPGSGTRIHWSFNDPAKAEGGDEEILGEFRRVRDEIDNNIKNWLGNL
jgi:arsenate reductase